VRDWNESDVARVGLNESGYPVIIHMPIVPTAVAEAKRKAEDARDEHKKRLRISRDEKGSDDDSKGRKLHLNRDSAAASRVSQSVYIKELEHSLNQIETQYISLCHNELKLQVKYAQLKSENERLESKLEYILAKQNQHFRSIQTVPVREQERSLCIEHCSNPRQYSK